VTADRPTAAPPAAPRADGAVFRVSDDGARWIAEGALTFANAGPALALSQALPLPSAGVIACAGIAAVDSAAVAVLLALKRRAGEAGTALAFVDAPPALAKLADLYGVDGILET
jgi:phospholipid transport system transporter-binding protein